MVRPAMLSYILRTRKFWLLGLLVLAGMALAVGSGEVLATGMGGMPVTAMLTLWPVWLTLVPAVAALSLAAKGMGWAPDLDMTLAGQVVVVYGLLGAGVVGWLWHRRRSRRPRQV
ncbi:hypothetical protein GlitD10_2389 [Gloeomargarita lithophora Alchichica-D10]|uniref:Uncharacterized protein n=2 Tax=Gloeomargarita TaxID=1188227 RepID=A0A1J0AFP5_9CYAN|nr:hypothetical protein GlitD10_2389 [Gloeomargarita lithophora Alchichica-D10]